MSTVKPQPPGSVPKAPKVSSSASHSRFGTLWSRQLPVYSGPHDVGVLDVEYPIPRQRIGSFRHRKLHTSEPAGIEIDTVLFSLFYPCDVSDKSRAGERGRGAVWFPRFGQTVAGFLQMAGRDHWFVKYLAYLPAFSAVHGLKFPAYQRAPLLARPGAPDAKWPVVIFSHGVGCSRLMYTHLCGELASRGYVVAAVEHRDGTGPSTLITSEDGKERHVDFLRWSDLEWPDEAQQPAEDTRLRKDQLLIRLAELHGTLDTVRRIARGDIGDERLKASRTYDFGPWEAQLDVGDGRICLAGHSFGGTAALAAAADPRFSPASIIALDPAVQRLEPWKGMIQCPVLCVNSEEFTDSDDYDRLLRLCQTVRDEKHVLSLAGTTHPSFSDVFLIVPSRIGSATGLHLAPYQVFVKTLQAIDIFLDRGEDGGTDTEALRTETPRTKAQRAEAPRTEAPRTEEERPEAQLTEVPQTPAKSSISAGIRSNSGSRRDRLVAMGREVTGRPKRPIGQPGEVLVQIA